MIKQLAFGALIGLIVAGSFAAASNHHVAIQIHPQATQEGGLIRLTCWVDRRGENRALDVGLIMEDGSPYSSSTIQLDGVDAPRAFHREYDRVPCGISAAYCNVLDSSSRVLDNARGPITVACIQ